MTLPKNKVILYFSRSECGKPTSSRSSCLQPSVHLTVGGQLGARKPSRQARVRDRLLADRSQRSEHASRLRQTLSPL